MRFRVRPEDFMVEEQVRLPLTQKGPYALYEVRKREVTTMEVQARIAATLGIPRSAVLFPALKDRHSMAVQHAAIKGTGPTVLEGRGYRARFVGRATRPLQPRDLRGNRFTVTVRDLRPGGARRLRGRLTDLERFGLPNYFDRQRFGSYAPNAGFPGKRILQRDVEGALQAYLRESLRGDPSPVRAFKSVAREHWGDWDVLFESAPRPSNFRSVLTFLRDHPADFRKALNLVTPRLLSLWLAAYQSFLWNRIAAEYLGWYLEEFGVRRASLNVLEDLPLYRELPDELLKTLSEVRIPLLHHRVAFSDPRVAEEARAVLKAESLSVGDFKARVLKRAYLSKGERCLLLFPQDVLVGGEEDDDHFEGRRKMQIAFSLPPGSYATLLLRILTVREL